MISQIESINICAISNGWSTTGHDERERLCENHERGRYNWIYLSNERWPSQNERQDRWL